MTELSPLDVLLKLMRTHWEAENHDAAVALAKVAAPYVHGKAPSGRLGGDLAGVSDEELEARRRGFRNSAAPEDSEESE